MTHIRQPREMLTFLPGGQWVFGPRMFVRETDRMSFFTITYYIVYVVIVVVVCFEFVMISVVYFTCQADRDSVEIR